MPANKQPVIDAPILGAGFQVVALPGKGDVAALMRLAEKQAKSVKAVSPDAPVIFLVEVPARARTQITGETIQDALAELDESSRGNRFIKVGDTWELTYQGVTKRGIKNAKGLSYIQYLLANENKWLELATLYRIVEPPRALPTDERGLGKMTTDEQEEHGLFLHDRVHSIHRHLSPADLQRLKNDKRVLEEKLTDPDVAPPLDAEERRQVVEEIEAIAQALEYENTFADDRSKLRKSISKLITEAIGNRIAQHHPILARHLSNCLEMGWDLRYLPEQPQRWQTNFQPITNATRKGALRHAK